MRNRGHDQRGPAALLYTVGPPPICAFRSNHELALTIDIYSALSTMSRSQYCNRDHIVSNDASLREIMTAPPSSAQAHAALRQRQMETRLRLEALKDERDLAADRGWH